jgi:phospholipid transport system substrate-binding protein
VNKKDLVIFLFFGCAIPLMSLAEGENSDPRLVVASATDRVMNIVRDARNYYHDNPEKYYQSIERELNDFVDFRGFARGVMGRYATSARYRNLDEPGRKKLKAQLDRFSEVVRESLVRTYSKGLLAFGGSRIELDFTSEIELEKNKVSVRQFIYSEKPEPYVVVYQMRKIKDGSWKLRNMIVEGVNLGQIFRSQFEAAVLENDGDLDKVISNWILEE